MSGIEKNLVRLVAKLSPWLAPLPSAYFVARSGMAHLGLPLAVAIIIAGILETLGLSTVHTALWAYEWNSHKRKADPDAPLGLAVLLAGAYLVATLSLVVLLEVWPSLSTYAPAIFPILALVGAVNLAIISRQELRESLVEAEKAEAREERKSRSLSRKGVQEPAGTVQEPVQGKAGAAREPVQSEARVRPEPVQNAVQDIHQGSLASINLSRQEKKRQLLDSMLDIYLDSPDMGATELSRKLGIGRSTLYVYQQELEEAGMLRKNGHGYIVQKGGN